MANSTEETLLGVLSNLVSMLGRIPALVSGRTPVSLGVGAATPTVIGTLAETAPSSATTAAGASVLTGLGAYENLQFLLTAPGNTGGTLDVYVQGSYDGGTTWYDRIAFTQLAAGAASTIQTAHAVLTGAVNTIGSGTTPALAAGTIVGGLWPDRIRLCMKSGANTSAGAAVSLTVIGSRLPQ